MIGRVAENSEPNKHVVLYVNTVQKNGFINLSSQLWGAVETYRYERKHFIQADCFTCFNLHCLKVADIFHINQYTSPEVSIIYTV